MNHKAAKGNQMSTYFTQLSEHTAFAEAKFTKADLAQGAHLFAGLNCFEPGQSQAVHAHAGADKFYLVLEGKARMRVGSEEIDAEAGTLVWAPAGVPHGVVEALERSVMLVGMSR
ncbi:MAG: cupin domain-containing protein [Gemmatimonadales bacterium]